MLLPPQLTVAKCLSLSIFTLLLLVTLASSAPAAETAVGWRNDGTGNFPQADPPRSWSTESNVVWKTELPGKSISSPVVISGKVFTLAQPSTLLCLDEATGNILWESSHDYISVLGEKVGQKVEADLEKAKAVHDQLDKLRKEYEAARSELGQEVAKTKYEPQMKALETQYKELTVIPPIPDGTPGNTASTPVSDGELVWTVFGTGIVSAHQMDGQRRWARFVANPGNRHSASPLLVGNLLIVDLDGLVALNPQTGETVWKAETSSRSGTVMSGNVGNIDILVTPSGDVVKTADGTVLAKQLFRLGYSSPLLHEDVIYAVDKGSTKAIKLLVEGGQLRTEQLWEQEGSRDDRLSSPVFHEGMLYTVTGKGVIEVYDAKTGEMVYKRRLPISRGRLDPSLALAGGMIYISTNRGATLLLEPGKEFKSLGENELEGFSSSPAFHGKRLFIRTNESLYCLGE